MQRELQIIVLSEKTSKNSVFNVLPLSKKGGVYKFIFTIVHICKKNLWKNTQESKTVATYDRN